MRLSFMQVIDLIQKLMFVGEREEGDELKVVGVHLTDLRENKKTMEIEKSCKIAIHLLLTRDLSSHLSMFFMI